MSTLFGILKSGGDIVLDQYDCIPEGYSDEDFIAVAFRGNSSGMRWKNELAPLLPPTTKVYPLDNSAQGVFTIGDIINEINSQKNEGNPFM